MLSCCQARDEWRSQYLDYKGLKDLIKESARWVIVRMVCVCGVGWGAGRRGASGEGKWQEGGDGVRVEDL
jgi:hypothetical protein